MSKFISVEAGWSSSRVHLIRLVVLHLDEDCGEEVQEHVFPIDMVDNIEIGYYPIREGSKEHGEYICCPTECWVSIYRKGWDSPLEIKASVRDAIAIRDTIFGQVFPSLVSVPKDITLDDDDEEYDDE
jgi:hypothetical protein